MNGLLFVCTGNICRSPLAESLTRAALQARFGSGPDLIEIASGGTRGMDDQPMWPLAAAELARRGIHHARFRSKPLEAVGVPERDLILTATLRHRNDVVSAYPSVRGKVFAWREFAWLLSGVGAVEVPGLTPAERLRILPKLATKRRGAAASRPTELMDVADPMGGDAVRFRQAADQTVEAIDVLVALL